MNRLERRKMVRNTKPNTVDSIYMIKNSKEISNILLQRFEYTLKEYGISYYIKDGEVKSDDKRVQEIYDSEAGKLINELKVVRGDYKKIKVYG